MLAYLNFRFKFIDNQGNSKSIIWREGRVSEEGLRLHGEMIMLRDIEKTFRYSNKIIIVLKPYITISKFLTDKILQDTHSIVIRVVNELNLAEDLKSTIDQKISELFIKEREQTLKAQGNSHAFRMVVCPNCSAKVDLSYHKHTPLTYCNYCEAIFESKGMPLPGTKSHTICPECNYYGRVRTHQETHFYLYPSSRTSQSRRHCCDTCASRMLTNTLKKNAPFLLGVPSNLVAMYKTRKGKSPSFPQLARANRVAQDGDMETANQLYTLLLLRNNTHPGLYYNHGLAYWQNGNEEAAAARFREALNLCSNYQPILEFLKSHTAEEQE